MGRISHKKGAGVAPAPFLIFESIFSREYIPESEMAFGPRYGAISMALTGQLSAASWTKPSWSG